MFGLNKEKKDKLSTSSYKGVRDFFPEDCFIQDYIFNTWKQVAESWGYSHYNASILEPLELYKAKTSEEIVNEQIYNFIDRGEREVALRPEMTPTVARMIAQKQNEIPMPARWYSIPNVFRYEKPQRGRLREHWQLNVDIFGSNSVFADAEIINIASDIMKKFGAKTEDFEIRINSRSIMNEVYERLGIDPETSKVVSRIIDKKDKISSDLFREALEKEVKEKADQLISIIDSKEGVFELLGNTESANRLNEVLNILDKQGVTNIVFSPSLTRGFDYYTDIIFEVFDTNPENSRSLFGGGRYDNLLEMFGTHKIAAIGFGMGDVTIRDFLETHNLLPKYSSSTHVSIVVVNDTPLQDVYKLAEEIRNQGINIAIDISGRKMGDQISLSEKRNIKLILPVGTQELNSNNFVLRRLSDRVEKNASRSELAEAVRELL